MRPTRFAASRPVVPFLTNFWNQKPRKWRLRSSYIVVDFGDLQLWSVRCRLREERQQLGSSPDQRTSLNGRMSSKQRSIDCCKTDIAYTTETTDPAVFFVALIESFH